MPSESVLSATEVSKTVDGPDGRLTILDGVDLDLTGGETFRAVCQQGRTLGFDGKTLIHPNQIAGANEIFGPSAAAIEHAQISASASGRATRIIAREAFRSVFMATLVRA